MGEIVLIIIITTLGLVVGSFIFMTPMRFIRGVINYIKHNRIRYLTDECYKYLRDICDDTEINSVLSDIDNLPNNMGDIRTLEDWERLYRYLYKRCEVSEVRDNIIDHVLGEDIGRP